LVAAYTFDIHPNITRQHIRESVHSYIKGRVAHVPTANVVEYPERQASARHAAVAALQQWAIDHHLATK